MADSINNRLGIVASALSSDPRAAPRLARQSGFGGLLFDAYGPQIAIPDLSVSGRREFLHTLGAQDQRLIGLRCDLGPKGFAPGSDVDREIARLDRAMESAAGLGAPLVCVDVGPLPPPRVAEKPKPAIAPEQAGLIIIPAISAAPQPAPASAVAPDPAFVSQIAAALAELGARADRYSVRLALSTSLASFASLRDALANVRCPWFGVDLDPVALLRDELDADAIFSMLGPLICHVRARDAIAGADKRTKPAPLGRGDTNWSELLSHLDGAGYSGLLTLDPMELPDRRGAAIAGAKYLRLLLE